MHNVPINYNQSNTTANLAAVDTSTKFSASLIANFSDSSATGTIKIQASNDKNAATVTFGNPIASVNWVDIPSMTATVVAGATVIIPKFDIAYQSIRPVWTSTGGSGTINVNLNLLGV